MQTNYEINPYPVEENSLRGTYRITTSRIFQYKYNQIEIETWPDVLTRLPQMKLSNSNILELSV